MFFAIVYISIITGCIVIDQVTKYLAHSGKSFRVIGSFLGIEKRQNHGMAFSMLSDWKHAQTFFCIMTMIVLVGVVIFLYKTTNKSKSLHVSIAFMVGGTLGNFIDRLALNYVRDFIALDLRIPILQFNCNPADVFITIGAVIFIVYCLFLDNDAIFRKKEVKE